MRSNRVSIVPRDRPVVASSTSSKAEVPPLRSYQKARIVRPSGAWKPSAITPGLGTSMGHVARTFPSSTSQMEIELNDRVATVEPSGENPSGWPPASPASSTARAGHAVHHQDPKPNPVAAIPARKIEANHRRPGVVPRQRRTAHRGAARSLVIAPMPMVLLDETDAGRARRRADHQTILRQLSGRWEGPLDHPRATMGPGRRVSPGFG